MCTTTGAAARQTKDRGNCYLLTGQFLERAQSHRNTVDENKRCNEQVAHLEKLGAIVGAVFAVGRQHEQWRYRKSLVDLAWSKTPSMHGHSMRENREIHWLPASDGAAGRKGKAKAVIQ